MEPEPSSSPIFLKAGGKDHSGDFDRLFAQLLSNRIETVNAVDQTVATIIADVKARGDVALLDYSQRFDRFALTETKMAITGEEVEAAIASCPSDTFAALNHAAKRIESFHRMQLPENLSYCDEVGVKLGYRWSPVASVGLYVPGGMASYPSSVLMNAIPAMVANVERIAMVVPTPDGNLNPMVLAAAKIAGITEIYRIGGAQAIAALAYGTKRIRPVDKIVGPGNAWVAAAKRQVFGTVGIDMIAGPSEILVVADSQNDPAWIAADILSQAEHDPSAQSILITDDHNFARLVEAAIHGHLINLSRKDIAEKSWHEHGAIILVDKLEQALPLINQIAPEHLELAIDNPEEFSLGVTNAGAIFLGRHTPEAIGDYLGGPNHVLPTSRNARFSSGLGVLDFMKRTTFLSCDRKSLPVIGKDVIILAESEGLPAHALSVSLRMGK